jgi:hypothetical protein
MFSYLSRWQQILLLVLLCVLLGGELYTLLAEPSDKFSNSPKLASGDFVAYWSAYQISREGGNPYDSQILFAKQKSIGYTHSDPQMYFNPPWLLFVLAPVLKLPFNQAARVWFTLNVCFLLILGFLSSRLIPHLRVNTWVWVSSTVFFVPVWDALSIGQLGIFVGLCFIGVLSALQRARYWLAGTLLGLLTVKPHCLYLALLAVICFIVERRLWKTVYAALAFVAVLYLGTALLLPSAVAHWDAIRQAPLYWYTPTLVGHLREMILERTGTLPSWPVIVMPAITASVFVAWIIRRRGLPDWQRSLAPLLCISLITAPYAWIADFSVLVVIQVMIVVEMLNSASYPKSRRRQIIAVLAIVQIIGYFLRYYFEGEQYFSWFPVAILLIWLFSRCGAAEISRIPSAT